MALKKPSDFFDNKKTPLDEVKESYDSARPEKIEQVSEAFDVFKSNLNHIQSLSDFTSTFDSFKNNLEKVESVSSEVSGIKEEIKNLIKKEDLDSAMMAQLLFVEQSISKIESKVSSINGKTVDNIREDFAKLSNTINGFLNVDVPKYKKLVAESEVRTDSRFATFKEGIEENLDEIKVDVNKEVTTALESIESVNENTINVVKAEVKETVRDVNKKVSELVEKELPKYKKLFAETEVKTEEKINSAIHSYKSTIETLSERVKEFTEEEIPKYSNLLIETKLKSEKEVKQLEEEVLSRVKILSEKVECLSEDVEEKTFERVQSLQDVVKEYKEEIESISKRYETLQKDFTGRVVHEDKKLSQYSKKLDKFSKRFSFIEETLTEDVRELKENLETNTSKFYTELKSEIDSVGQNIAQTVKDLEVNIVINENHLKKQNEHIGNIQEEVKDVLDKLQLDVLEKKNAQLVERINHVEEVFSKINEKTLLTEDNPTLPGDPSTKNSGDPLTPLDQNFVTLDQLQNHYRTFINRIQQQIATIGGGGAGFIKDLDDVTFNESTGENQLLIYNGSKWVGIASTALSGGSGGDASTASKLVLDVRNNNIGYALTIGTPVYQTAYNSGLDRLDIEESRASNSTTMPAKGVVSEDLANNTSGQIIVYGELEGVNTHSFDVGDELYVAPGGGLTNVRPTDPTHLVQKIAVVLKKSTANGAILVYGAGRANDVPNNISIAGSITAADGFFSGNVTVGGTITYEDVKNVDSIGIVTARTGVDVLAGGINAVGVVTATSFVGDGSQLSNIISGVGIQSGSTRIGTGFTDINFTGAGVTVVGSGTTVTVDIPSSTITRQTETSSGVTTDFTITGGYTVGLIDVYLNGVKQRTGVDFTATDGSTVTMTPFISDGDVVEFQKYDKLNIAGITSVTNATNAYNIVGGVSFATSAGIATALNSDSSINTSGIITASQLAVSGLSTSKDLLVTGITSATNIIEIKSNDSTPGRIDLYCETNNAHYARLQAPEHGDFGGNITVKLPASTGTLLLSDGSGASLTSLNASNLGSGTIPDARFPATLPAISGQNLTGIVTGITAGSNITVLENPSGNFIITATGGGGDTVSINASAGDILSASSGEISADDAGSDKLVFWDDSESKLTYLTAGSGLSISGTTITASGGGGSSGVEIENNGTSVGTGITAINFSTNVTATASGGIATVTASGGGGGGSEGPSSVMMGMIF